MRHTILAAVLGVLLALPGFAFDVTSPSTWFSDNTVTHRGRQHNPGHEVSSNGVTKVQMQNLYKEDWLVTDVDMSRVQGCVTNLIAGRDIIIEEPAPGTKKISAIGGGSGGVSPEDVNYLVELYDRTNLTSRINAKQDQLTAGSNITITVVGNQTVISATGRGGSDIDWYGITNVADAVVTEKVPSWARETVPTITNGFAKLTDLPTKVSDLTNDAEYVTKTVTNGLAKVSDLPTKLSDLTNDMEYVTRDVTNGILTAATTYTDSATNGLAKVSDLPTKLSDLTNDTEYVTRDVTNGILTAATTYTDSATNGLATAESVTVVSNALDAAKADKADTLSGYGITDAYTKTETTAAIIGNVVDNMISTNGTKALSANQGRILKDEIDRLKGRGKYLSIWNAVTGLAMTSPLVDPYTYQSGDYFIVGIISPTNTILNYKPFGTTYTTNTPSTVVETNIVAVNDTYIFDGTTWMLMHSGQQAVTFGSIAGSPDDNTALKTALDGKRGLLDLDVYDGDDKTGDKLATTGGVLSAVSSVKAEIEKKFDGYVPFEKDSRGNLTAVTIGSRPNILTAGLWSEELGYFQNDIVNKDGKLYICVVDPTDWVSPSRWSLQAEMWREVKVGECSFVNGLDSVAGNDARGLGKSTHAEGSHTHAEGYYTHAEGDSTHAAGEYTHAEGSETCASGNATHAEGWRTYAEGNSTHAEGTTTRARGSGTHAEGRETRARGSYAHAEGGYTTAGKDDGNQGRYAHAAGFNAYATNTTAFTWNGSAKDDPSDDSRDVDYVPPYGDHGNGTYNINPAGGLSGFWVGEMNMADHIRDAVYNDVLRFGPVFTNEFGGLSIKGEGLDFRDIPRAVVNAKHYGPHGFTYDYSVFQYFPEYNAWELFGGNIAKGPSYTNQIAICGNSDSANNVVIGFNASTFDVGTVAIGYGAAAIGENTIAIGNGASSGGVAIGSLSLSGVDGVVIGNEATTTPNKYNDTVIGYRSSVDGDFGTVIGSISSLTGDDSTVIGSRLCVTGNHSIVIGSDGTSIGDDVVLIGSATHASGESAVAIGNRSYAIGDYTTAISGVADAEAAVAVSGEASAPYSIAIGGYCDDEGADSAIVIGLNGVVEAESAIGIGGECEVCGTNSVAIGRRVRVYEPNALVISDEEYDTDNGTNTIKFGFTDDPNRIYFKDTTLADIIRAEASTPGDYENVSNAAIRAYGLSLSTEIQLGLLSNSVERLAGEDFVLHTAISGTVSRLNATDRVVAGLNDRVPQVAQASAYASFGQYDPAVRITVEDISGFYLLCTDGRYYDCRTTVGYPGSTGYKHVPVFQLSSLYGHTFTEDYLSEKIGGVTWSSGFTLSETNVNLTATSVCVVAGYPECFGRPALLRDLVYDLLMRDPSLWYDSSARDGHGSELPNMEGLYSSADGAMSYAFGAHAAISSLDYKYRTGNHPGLPLGQVTAVSNTIEVVTLREDELNFVETSDSTTVLSVSCAASPVDTRTRAATCRVMLQCNSAVSLTINSSVGWDMIIGKASFELSSGFYILEISRVGYDQTTGEGLVMARLTTMSYNTLVEDFTTLTNSTVFARAVKSFTPDGLVGHAVCWTNGTLSTYDASKTITADDFNLTTNGMRLVTIGTRPSLETAELWSAAAEYHQGDIVQHDGILYICSVHPVATLGPSDWDAQIGAWSEVTLGINSVAAGSMNVASGDGSHAEGINTHADGDTSHAEGIFTRASGTGAHAAGYRTLADGSYTHAEGDTTHAEGTATHASGTYTHAEGFATSAEGNTTHAEGDSTHAEGDQTHAEGYYTHAEGYYTHAAGYATHAEGFTTSADGTYTHAEGRETNAEGDSTHAEGGYTHADGTYTHAEGYYTHASGNATHAEGFHTRASGTYTHAEGRETNAEGDSTHAEGGYTTAGKSYGNIGRYAHAAGFNAYATNTTAFTWNGSAKDDPSNSSEDVDYVPPYGDHGNGTYNINPAGGLEGFWVGEMSMADHIRDAVYNDVLRYVPMFTSDCVKSNMFGEVLIGDGGLRFADGAVKSVWWDENYQNDRSVFRYYPSTESWDALGGTAEGDSVYQSLALGGGNAYASYSVAIGYGAGVYVDASNEDGGVAIGWSASATGFSTALGYNAFANGYATALGYNASATNGYATALGLNATASGYFSTALGYNASANDCATALGDSATASGYFSTALGYNASAYDDYSVFIGSAQDEYGTTYYSHGQSTITFSTTANPESIFFQDTTLADIINQRAYELIHNAVDSLDPDTATTADIVNALKAIGN